MSELIAAVLMDLEGDGVLLCSDTVLLEGISLCRGHRGRGDSSTAIAGVPLGIRTDGQQTYSWGSALILQNPWRV